MNANQAASRARKRALQSWDRIAENTRSYRGALADATGRLRDRARDIDWREPWDGAQRDLIAGGIGLAAGVAVATTIASARGRSRRAELVSQAVRAVHEIGENEAGSRREARESRPAGKRGSWRRGNGAPDEKLEGRVRSALGRLVSHPSAIDVSAHQGTVTLRGPVLRREVRKLLARVTEVRGVDSIENRLDVHDSTDHPSLRDDGAPLSSRRSAPMRVAAGASGLALLGYGLARRDLAGGLVSLLGLGMLAGSAGRGRAASLARRAADQVIDVHQAITIDAPVEEVYRFWSHFDNWPDFMEHIEEVRVLDDHRSRWVATAPMGLRVSWDAEITEQRPNSLIAWRSLPGSTVATSGVVRFQREGSKSRVSVILHYTPPGGALGHVVASLFGDDPRQALEDDLSRMKHLIESHARTGQRAPAEKRGDQQAAGETL